MPNDFIVVSGSSNQLLAKNIAASLFAPFADVELSKFACSESRIRIKSDIKDKVVLLVQSTSSPANDHLVEVLLLIDAIKRMMPKKIIGIIPWFGYAPQDKVFRPGEPLSSEVVVGILENAGISEFVICDIHSALVLEKFSKKTHHIKAQPLFVKMISEVIDNPKNWVVAILDKGNTERSKSFASDLGLDLVRFEKSRDVHTGRVTFHKLNGSIKNKHVLVYDDYISTGQTLLDSAKYVKENGAITYTCCVTHVAVAQTLEKIHTSHIDCFITTNTIDFALPEACQKVIILDTTPLIAHKVKKGASIRV